MSKITYEEAKECLRSINDFEDVYIEDLVTFRTTKQFDDKIKALENFLEQHRPPTLDEVISIALKHNFDCWFEKDMNRIVFGAALPEFFVYKEKVVSAMPHTHHYFKDYDLFNLARRYLQSQRNVTKVSPKKEVVGFEG